MILTGKTRLYGVIGNPVEHTLSPAMHNAAFEHLNLNCVFLAFEVKPTEVENALVGVRCLGISGLNVTMPHKHSVVPYLDDVDETAKVLSSVNTICNREGRLIGYSTDGIGALRALQENGVKLKGKRLLLLGGGGAAKAIAYALAPKVDGLVMLNRTPEKTKHLIQELSRRFNKKVTSGVLSTQAVKKHIRNVEILVNATPVGMFPNVRETLVPSGFLRDGLTVMDIVYHPIETQLAKDAKAEGARVISGVEMLIYQGAESLEIWTGCKAPIEVMKKAALEQLSHEMGEQ
jgi:shikimate dehydrogenase